MKKALYTYIPLIRDFIHTLDRTIETLGPQEASRRLLNKSHTQIRQQGMNAKIKEVLAKEPVIVVSNHRFFFDIFFLASLFPDRRSSYVVASTIFSGMSKQLDKHILPVSIRHHVLAPSKWITRFFIRFGYRVSRQLKHSQREAQVFNRKTIACASRLLADNALILYFPQLKKGTRWFSGIGHLIVQSGSLMKQKKLTVVFAHINGFSRWDFLRIFPSIGKLLPPIRVSFLGYKVIPAAIFKQNPQHISSFLQKEYEKKLPA